MLKREVYRELLDIPVLARPPIFDVSSGMLLSRNLHHRYDRLEWSFYYRVSVHGIETVEIPSIHPLISL